MSGGRARAPGAQAGGSLTPRAKAEGGETSSLVLQGRGVRLLKQAWNVTKCYL